MNAGQNWLIAAGLLSLVAALLHIACIIGGPPWYRFMGAGEAMASAAGRGEIRVALITAGIAVILLIWAAYAFSGAGLIPRLPLLRLGLVVISAIYLLRGLELFYPPALARPDLSQSFLIVSSVIVLIFGCVYAVGSWLAWDRL